MKKFLIIIIILFHGLSGYNQTVNNKQLLVAHNELELSITYNYAGMAYSALGFGVMYCAYTIKPNINKTSGKDLNKSTRIFTYSTGGVILGLGIVYFVESKIHLKKAGLILNKNGNGIGIGIGIRYKL